MKTLRIVLFVVVAIFCGFSANAQLNTSSPYSRFGLGDMEKQGLGWNDGMGGVGIGMRSFYQINTLNPAAVSAMENKNFIYEVGLRGRSVKSEEGDISQTNTEMNFSYLAMQFPITKRWFMGLGIKPYSSVGYEMEFVDYPLSIAGESQSNYINYRYWGEGGVNDIYWTNSFRVTKNFSAGATATYKFGNLERSMIMVMRDSSASEYSSVVTTIDKIEVGGFHYSFGLQYSDTIGVFNPKENKSQTVWTVGVRFDNKQTIYGDQNHIAVNEIRSNGSSTQYPDSVSFIENENRDIEIPQNIGVGFSVNRNNKLTLAADFYMQDWTDALFLDKKTNYLTSSYLANAGIEYIPNVTSFKYLNLVRYRLGGYYKKNYWTFNDEDVKSYGLSIGLGLPLRRVRAMINLSFEVGARGSVENIKETYARFSFSFTYHANWFNRRKFD